MGFFMARIGFEAELMSELTFSICVWAVLLATFMSPFLFKYALNKKHEYVFLTDSNNDDDAFQGNKMQRKTSR